MIRSTRRFEMKRIGLGLVLQLSVLAPAFAQTKAVELYPPIEPLRSGYLRVADTHELYWEVCGNPSGIPAIELSKAFTHVKLELPPATGHLQSEPANTQGLLRGVEWVAAQMR
jgi:hypothetical protein